MTTHEQLVRAKESTLLLRGASTEQKNNFLNKLSDLLIKNTSEILVENKKYLDGATSLAKAMKKKA